MQFSQTLESNNHVDMEETGYRNERTGVMMMIQEINARKALIPIQFHPYLSSSY